MILDNLGIQVNLVVVSVPTNRGLKDDHLLSRRGQSVGLQCLSR